MESGLLRHLTTFVQAARAANFSVAARSLGLTPGAVSKSVRALESGLGARLFHRSTHAMELTEDGEHLLDRVEPLLEQLGGALDRVRAVPGVPRGTLRVAAPSGFGKQFIVPLLAEFSAQYPDVILDLRFEDQLVDLIAARIDVAIGLRFAPRGALVSKKLCDARLFTVASPDFIERHGAPRSPQELEQYRCIGYRAPNSEKLRPYYYRGDDGADSLRTLTPAAAVIGTDQELICELAAQGLGIAMVGWVALPYIEAGTLVPLLESYAARLPPMMIYYQSRENVSPKVRAFIDYLEANLRPMMVRKSGKPKSRRR